MTRISAAALRARLDLRSVLGLSDPEVPNWEQVRAARLRDVRRMLPVARASCLFNALALAAGLWGTMPSGQLLLWLCAVLATLTRAGGFGLPTAAAPGDAHLGARLFRAGLRATISGLVWSVPPLLFAVGQDPDAPVAVCLVMGAVLATAIFTLSAIPLAMAGFVLPVAFGLTVMMARTGSAVLTMLPPIYVGALLACGLAIGHFALRRRMAETALAEEAEIVSLLLREFADTGADWLWEIDLRKRLVSVTPRLAQALDRPADALREQSLIALLAEDWPGGHPPELRALLDLIDGRASFKDHMLPLMVAGDRRMWRLSGAPRYGPDGHFAGYRGVGTDVTEQSRRIERIDRLAHADGLTDIDNRHGFTERLRGAIERTVEGAPPCALVLVDLDRFKAVNDTYGHPVGDKVLRAAAARLAGLVAVGGGCGRLGGDEFAMLVPDADDHDSLAEVARRAQQALSQAFEIDGTVLHIGASIGVAVAPRDGSSVETLMRNADLALYRAKRNGGVAPHHFTPAMHDPDTRSAPLEEDVPQALAQGQVTLAYAPIVGAADGRPAGFAASPCWNHPRHGVIAAEALLGLADAREQAAIGSWSAREACRVAAGWAEDMRLLLNLSPAQARDPQLPAAIREALESSRLEAGRLVLGIPETVATAAGAARTIAPLCKLGVQLALDGAEGGFAALRGGRFTMVRLASPLLEGAARSDPASVALVRAIVSMADALGVETVAAGGDGPLFRAQALRFGCDLIEEPPAQPARALEAAGAHDSTCVRQAA